VPGDVVVFLDDLDGLIDAVLLAFDGQPRVVQMRAHVEGVLEQAHIFIQCAEEGFDLSGNVNGTSHPIGRFSSYRNRVADGIPPLRVTALRSSQEETNYTLTQAPGRVKLHADDISKRELKPRA